MIALLWKDVQLSLNVLFLGLVLMLMPYAFQLAAEWNGTAVGSWQTAAQRGWPYSLGAIIVSAVFLGGSALACEREDGSAVFLSQLPPSRWQIAASKLIVSLGQLAALFMVDDLIVQSAGAIGPDEAARLEYLSHVGAAGGVSVLALGVSWLLSCRSRRSLTPVLLTIIFGMAAVAGLRFWHTESGTLDRSLLYVAAPAIGVLGLLGGTFLFVRHEET